MDLYADENFSDDCADELRRLGHNVRTVHQDGLDRSPDCDVLARAFALNRVLLTLNRKDFRRHCIEGVNHCGIASASHDEDFVSQAIRLDAALRRRTLGRWHIYVDKGGVRDEDDVLRQRPPRC